MYSHSSTMNLNSLTFRQLFSWYGIDGAYAAFVLLKTL